MVVKRSLKSRGTVKVKRVSTSLREERYKLLCEEAKKYHWRATTLLEEAAFALLENRPLIPKDLLEIFTHLTNLLNNIASNINQVIKKAHIFSRLSIKDVKYLAERVKELEKMVMVYLIKYLQANDRKVT
jgi:hypothetical protein